MSKPPKTHLRVVLWRYWDFFSDAEEIRNNLNRIIEAFGPATPIFLGSEEFIDNSEEEQGSPETLGAGFGVGIVVEIDTPLELQEMRSLERKELEAQENLPFESQQAESALAGLNLLEQKGLLTDPRAQTLREELQAQVYAMEQQGNLGQKVREARQRAFLCLTALRADIKSKFDLHKSYSHEPHEKNSPWLGTCEKPQLRQPPV